MTQSNRQLALFPEKDADWTEQHWRSLLESLIADNILSWREVTALVLGHLNPSQVGTSLASRESFKRHFPKRQAWQAVRSWNFAQVGTCADCQTRLELQADHIISKEIIISVGNKFRHIDAAYIAKDRASAETAVDAALAKELAAAGYSRIAEQLRKTLRDDLLALLAEGKGDRALETVADRLENMAFRCRRCNVIRRPSHKKGGKTFLTAEAALMWLLFAKVPSTYEAFAGLCREYGLSMANIRFEEAWAMARWLEKAGRFKVDSSSRY